MKSVMKRVTSILLAFAMVLCLEFVNFANAAAAPVKQGWETVMAVGDSATFAVKGAYGYTVTWDSSTMSVAAVEKSTGIVTAVKPGTAQITATIAKGKETVSLSGNVTVKDAQNTVVKTKFGNVKGIRNGKNVTWYGIPYGAEPVGKLRWKNPQDPAVWSDTLDCTKNAAVALQYAAASKSVIGSTNCLNLDVYASNVKGAKLPVLVFFHGGNNQTGSSFGDLTGTDIAVKDDCLVVSVNYRLGLLGFNCLPALQTENYSTGNYGLVDMQKSLRWVKENISQFGGDPNNVTISGHSAGGRDVMAMLISPIFRGLFQKAIVSSGGMTTADVGKSASQIASFLAPIAVKDGKALTAKQAQAWLLTSGSDVRDYLYSIPSNVLMAAVGDAAIRMSAFPHLFADGVVIPKESFGTTKYNDVPVIMATGSDEFSFFNNGTAYTDGSISKEELAAAQKFGNTYGSQMYGYFNACASAQTMVANGFKSPIYLMNFNFGHDTAVWPDMPMGSYHGVFLSALDSNYAIRGYFAAAYKTKGADRLGPLTHGYIKDFLWSSAGNPNSTDRAAWTNYTSASSKWLVLDATRDAASSAMKDIGIASYAQVFTAMDADTTISPSAKASVIKTILNGRWFSSELDNKYGNVDLWK